jgi:DNA-binding NarL/FixJ family response regulator
MERLVLAIKTVLAGDIWLHPEIGKRVLQTYTASPPPSEKLAAIRDFGLTGREREVLTLCVDGLSNNEMARCMCVTLETVKTHMRHIMEKLVVRDRTQAAVKALKHGLA